MVDKYNGFGERYVRLNVRWGDKKFEWKLTGGVDVEVCKRRVLIRFQLLDKKFYEEIWRIDVQLALNRSSGWTCLTLSFPMSHGWNKTLMIFVEISSLTCYLTKNISDSCRFYESV